MLSNVAVTDDNMEVEVDIDGFHITMTVRAFLCIDSIAVPDLLSLIYCKITLYVN